MTSAFRDTYNAGYDPDVKYNPNALEHLPIQLKTIGGIFEGIGTGIGLASGAVHNALDKRKGRSEGGWTVSWTA